MKKILLLISSLIFSYSSFSQAETESGTFLLLGNTAIEYAGQSLTGMDPSDAYDDNNSITSNNLKINLTGGYFVGDGLMLGLTFSNSSEKTIEKYTNSGYTDEDEQSTSTMLVGPTVRYYFGETGVWSQVAYGFGSSSTKDVSKSTGSTTTTYETDNPMSILSFGAGYAISLSDYVSLNPSIGYSIATTTVEDGYFNLNTGNYSDLKIMSAGLDFKLGLAIHLSSY